MDQRADQVGDYSQPVRYDWEFTERARRCEAVDAHKPEAEGTVPTLMTRRGGTPADDHDRLVLKTNPICAHAGTHRRLTEADRRRVLRRQPVTKCVLSGLAP